MKRYICVNKILKKQAGFTLIEILIVVILLGILATIIIPQVRVSSDDAELNSLKTNLNSMRDAIRLYYHQHSHIYPGGNSSAGLPASTIAVAAGAFVKQLTMYTRLDGKTSTKKDETYKFGPYLKSDELPLNLFNNDNDVLCDITTTDISAKTSDGSTGWKFYTKTGVLLANDGAHNDL